MNISKRMAGSSFD